MKRKTALILGGVIVVILIIAFVVSSRSGGSAAVAQAMQGDLVKTVKVSGKIAPLRDTSLGFQVGGTIASVSKDVGDSVAMGDVIVELDRASLQANLLKAQADLNAAEAELDKLQGGASAQAQVTNAKSEIVQAIIDAYTNADDAIHSKVDQIFRDPRTANPQIKYFFDGSDLEKAINQRRVAVESDLVAWRAIAMGLDAASYTPEALNRSQRYLQSVAAFLDDMARVVSGYKSSDALTQASIDKYKTDILAGRSSANQALATLISKNTALSNTMSDVPVQIARVSAAQATVADYKAQLSNTQIRAPFAGVVSKQDAKVGQAVSPNASLVSVISKEYKVEAYVPEVSIAGLALGNTATTTLDAYGTGIAFPMTVTHIDPAETIRDGVSNYKIELRFSKPDERIRSGMTANVTIETLRKPGVVLIPARSVVTDAKGSRAFVQDGKEAAERPIEIGISDSSGNVEVVSGISAGETVLLDPVSK